MYVQRFSNWLAPESQRRSVRHSKGVSSDPAAAIQSARAQGRRRVTSHGHGASGGGIGLTRGGGPATRCHHQNLFFRRLPAGAPPSTYRLRQAEPGPISPHWGAAPAPGDLWSSPKPPAGQRVPGTRRPSWGWGDYGSARWRVATAKVLPIRLLSNDTVLASPFLLRP